MLLLFEYLYNTLIGPKILETEKALMEAEGENEDIKSDGKYFIYCTLIAFLFFQTYFFIASVQFSILFV